MDFSMFELTMFLHLSFRKEERSTVLCWYRRKLQAQQYQMIQRLDYMESNNFGQLISVLQQGSNFSKAWNQANQRYLIKSYKISEFNPIKVTELYGIMRNKFYFKRTKPSEDSWCENELRIYIWLLIGYLFIHDKQILNMTETDWQYFVSIFNHRSYTFFQYQSISLLKHTSKSPKWTPEQSTLLEQIIEFKQYQKKWNSIARQLYQRSGKRYYRNPKQCRQHWMNHLDPVKLHCEWTQDEDVTLMTTVKNRGKKWSLVVKKLNNTRTEHMVKNRYKSLIYNQLKKYPTLNQNQISTQIISKLGSLNKSEILVNPINVLQRSSLPKQDIAQELGRLQKFSLMKNSNISEEFFQDLINSPRISELSESNFLNSPLPIPWSFAKDQIMGFQDNNEFE